MSAAPDAGKLYGVPFVAGWLGHTPRWFYRNHEALRRRGFPLPAVTVGRRRWLGQDLLAWASRRDARLTITGGSGKVVILAETIAALRSKSLGGPRARAVLR